MDKLIALGRVSTETKFDFVTLPSDPNVDGQPQYTSPTLGISVKCSASISDNPFNLSCGQ